MNIMKRLAFTYIICNILLFGSCRKQDAASKEVEAYLSEHYQLTVNDSTIYCFFPANQCKNCFRYDAAYLAPEISEHCVIITGYEAGNFKGFRHVLHDADDDMLRLQALDYGNRIILFKSGNISRNEVVTDLYSQLGNVWRGM